MERVNALLKAEFFDLQDLALAQVAIPYSKDLPDLPFVTAWVSRWTRQGHICLSTALSFSESIDSDVDLSTYRFPDLKAWADAVPENHPFVSDGSRRTPLVVDREHGLIYLHRWYMAEQRVADAILDRIHNPGDECVLTPKDHDRLTFHFPSPDSAAQKRAVQTAMQTPFALITGGPGTGKTTTILKLIDLFVHHYGKDVKIALCAPTGKAVSRMEESIREQGGRSTDASVQAIARFDSESPTHPPVTLHRLLGLNPVKGTCRYNQKKPLPYDLIVLDESSMVDLLLMHQLVQAMKRSARLVLVGDKDQLPAVGAGTLFADLCKSPGLQACTALLDINWRAKEAPEIVRLAGAINRGAADEAIRLLEDGSGQVRWFREDTALADLLKSGALPHWQKIKQCKTAQEAFRQMAEFQLLCAVRKGERGVSAINEKAMELLGEKRAPYHGLPIMISVNEYQHKLYNGDTGIMLNDEHGTLRAYFPVAGGFRSLDLSRLPAYEPLYATTIHKSQGSEAQEILLVLPSRDSAVLTVELLYTGITRARRMVSVFGEEEILRMGITRSVERASGIGYVLDQKSVSKAP